MNTMEWKGEPIAEPGMVVGMPLETYHGDPCISPSVSSSGLRTILQKSPLHYWAHSPYNPARWPKKATSAMNLGSAAHHLLLEGDTGFVDRFAIRPSEFPDWRTAAARSWRTEQEAAGRIVITDDDLARVRGMRDSLSRLAMVRGGLLDGMVERSLFCRTEEGVWLRARPDVIPTEGADYVDLKTTSSVSYRDLQGALTDYDLHVQGSVTRMLCRALGMPFNAFAFVFVESEPPFDCAVVELKPHELDAGEDEARAAIKAFARGITTGKWPGKAGNTEDARYIERPSWAQDRSRERVRALTETTSLEAAE